MELWDFLRICPMILSITTSNATSAVKNRKSDSILL